MEAVRVRRHGGTARRKAYALVPGRRAFELWTACGLHRVEERPLEITMRFQSFTDYWEPFLLGQAPAGAYLKRIPEDRLPLLRREEMSRLRIAKPNEPFSLPARVWAVRGNVGSRPP